jgi:hypothetical protein
MHVDDDVENAVVAMATPEQQREQQRLEASLGKHHNEKLPHPQTKAAGSYSSLHLPRHAGAARSKRVNVRETLESVRPLLQEGELLYLADDTNVKVFSPAAALPPTTAPTITNCPFHASISTLKIHRSNLRICVGYSTPLLTL